MNTGTVNQIENEIRVWSFQNFGNGIALGLSRFMGKLLFAILVFLIGRYCIKKLVSFLPKSRICEKINPTVRPFAIKSVRFVLYFFLGISCISILGIPMASLITLLASAGVAVGLALQGSLSNLAGGIMLLLFRPFQVHDYIKSGTDEGTVQEVSVFYTIILSPDNKKISIPNGNLMNSNIINYSSEALRRVDLSFSVAREEDPEKVEKALKTAVEGDNRILHKPEAFFGITEIKNDALCFSIRVWVENKRYWDVYNTLNKRVILEFYRENIAVPNMKLKSISTAVTESENTMLS
jgi:mscS family small conductance mechanosenstive ion channel